jgi:hypothetical protein
MGAITRFGAGMEVPELTTNPTRVPAALWECLQRICWEQDNRFLEDAARIINVPAAEIKRRVLGTRGVLSAVVTTTSNWYDGEQCPIMIECGERMLRRCCEPAESNGFCWSHRKGKGIEYDSEYVKSLEVREAWRIDGQTVWVDADGIVYDRVGKILKGLHIDTTNGIIHDSRPTPPPWTREELAAAAGSDCDD